MAQLELSLAELPRAKLEYPMVRPVAKTFKLYYQAGQQKTNMRNLGFLGLKSVMIEFFVYGRVTPQIFGLTMHEILVFEHLLLGIYKLKPVDLKCHNRPKKYLSEVEQLTREIPRIGLFKVGLLVLRFVLERLRKLDEEGFLQKFGWIFKKVGVDLSICCEKFVKKLDFGESEKLFRFYKDSLDLGTVFMEVFAETGISSKFEEWILSEFCCHIRTKIEKKIRYILTILNFVKNDNFTEFFSKILFSLEMFESNFDFISPQVFLKILSRFFKNRM